MTDRSECVRSNGQRITARSNAKTAFVIDLFDAKLEGATLVHIHQQEPRITSIIFLLLNSLLNTEY